jgi:hypothetical protein
MTDPLWQEPLDFQGIEPYVNDNRLAYILPSTRSTRRRLVTVLCNHGNGCVTVRYGHGRTTTVSRTRLSKTPTQER